jgi:16S rRNA (guanine1207-N2)-methyltransferase
MATADNQPRHYFDATPTVASCPHEVTLTLPEAKVTLTVDRGVFSAGRVDPGTLNLLRSVTTVPAAGAVLDLGCGYGPIAVTLARRAPGVTVWAVDINERAVGLARANAVRLGLANLTAATPDQIPSDLRFAAIWSNPPIRVGNQALHALLESWLVRLEPTGEAWLVVHRHLGADSLAAWLREQGWTVTRHASKKGYRILLVRPDGGAPGGRMTEGTRTTEGPHTTEGPRSSERPRTTEGPRSSERPGPSEGPGPSERPRPSEGPGPSKRPRPSEEASAG